MKDLGGGNFAISRTKQKCFERSLFFDINLLLAVIHAIKNQFSPFVILL